MVVPLLNLEGRFIIWKLQYAVWSEAFLDQGGHKPSEHFLFRSFLAIHRGHKSTSRSKSGLYTHRTVANVILVDVVTRQLTGVESASSDGHVSHFTLMPGNATDWLETDVDLTSLGTGNFWVTRMPDGTTWFLPQLSGAVPFTCIFSVAGDGRLDWMGLTPHAVMDLSSLKGLTLAATTLDAGRVLATTTAGWDWLSEVRLGDGYVVGVFNSAPVRMTVQPGGNCNELSCEGCATLQLQRMCLAYGKCALINCVGTPVHQRKPLCGVGGLLKHTGDMALRSTHAAWVVFAEMLGLVLSLRLLHPREAQLLWPEDSFLCYVCAAKDGSAEFFSILTATLNMALQLSGANVGYLYGGASNVNRNADAVLTIGATALNAFMHQIALLPLFLMVASHQVMTCQTVGVVALIDSADSFKVNLIPPDQTTDSDAIAGQCLTASATALTQYPTDSGPGLGTMVASLLSSAADLLLESQIEPALHYVDMGISYLIGVLKSFAVLLMSQTMARCNPPDFAVRHVVVCACGDRPLSIRAAARAQGLLAKAHWCTGVLSMLDGNGQPMYVYNPYTYDEVVARAAGMQAYVDCLSAGTQGYSCTPPTDPVFQQQGVNALNVLVACRENYVNRRWDPAAFVLYGRPVGYPLKVPTPMPGDDACGVLACLQQPTYASGSLAQECLQAYLACAGLSSDDYFAYEHVSADGPEHVDACLVFSGPALAGPPFAGCVDGPDEGNCTLPGHCWTPQSSGNVPVCEQHVVLSAGGHLDGTVQRLYQTAQALVHSAVQDAIAEQYKTQAVMSFFSVEGDVLHQTADCMFMGPYSRVDYWPMPACGPGQECLAGPYWARDEGAGATRNVDINHCPAETSLPYTCGSVARRSLMRYFVTNVLAGNGAAKNKNMSVMREIMLATLRGIDADWANTSRFGCACPGSAELLPSCCGPGSELLPPQLNKTFTSLQTDTVLLALEDDFTDVFQLATDSHLPWFANLDAIRPGTRASYDWRGSKRAEDEARLNPVQPSLNYTWDEAMTPVLTSSSTLWDLCHGALKQLLFTLPLSDTGLRFDALDPFDGNMSRIEEYVRAFTAEALDRSPLFRHYAPRHAPSDSQMCASGPGADQSQGAVTWDSFVQAGATLLDNSKGALPPLPAYGPQRFRVGEAGCLCGWPMAQGRCQAPAGATCAAVCRLVPCAACWYNASLDAGLAASFDPAWSCPAVEVSTHWGVLDADATELWLARNATALNGSTRDLLTHGRAGLRVGSLGAVRALAKQRVSPATREVPLERGRLTGCPGNRPAWASDLSQAFVEQLFPAAQGVEEAGAVSYCLRYTIEVARYTALELVDPLAAATLAQREAVERWRVRCGAQLQIVTLCVGLDAYRPRAFGTDRPCPHFTATGLSAGDYATPECLVRVGGTYYDPCRCVPCVGAQATPLMPSQYARPECEIRFDPRAVAPPGLPLGYVDGQAPDLPAPVPAFPAAALDDPDAAGNALPGAAWWASEGPMDGTSQFCDMVQDWWPEWDFPVGYHVTVPCDAGDTAYRTFVQSFAVDRTGAQPALVYQHDLLRDAGLVDTTFGVGGLCRTTNFGMPMPVTNTMRYCTAVPLDGAEDFTIPGLHAGSPEPAYASWQCAPDSSDLPWPDWVHAGGGVYRSSQYSVGTVPNMPPARETLTYPATLDDMFEVGPWQDLAGNRWGTSAGKQCSDYALYLCAADPDCPTGFTCKGRMCSNNAARKCTSGADCGAGGLCQGICMDAGTQCRRHDDCPDGVSLCSGVGTCEAPTLVLVNTLTVNASLQLQVASACPAGSAPFSLKGGSFYAHPSTDLLRAHGMCSFEDWFRYTYTTLRQCAANQTRSQYVDINPTACTMLYVEDPPGNQTSWWASGKSRPDFMYLRPTNCDRDYERLAGFQQCAPTPGMAGVLDAANAFTTVVQQDRYVRLHESQSSIHVAVMPESGTPAGLNLGFLGLGSANNITRVAQLQGDGGNNFIACASLSQCYPAKFTVKGVAVTRNATNPDTGLLSLYPPGDAFKCGAFGIMQASTGMCALDAGVTQLYTYLCGPGLLDSCKLLFDRAQADRTRYCAAVLPFYEPANAQRVANLRALTELFHMFPTFSTFDQYLDVVQCSSDLYTQLGGLSLYYPFMFSLYEVPFDWFYQCLVMAGSDVNPAFRGSQDCAQFGQRQSYSPSWYVTPAGKDDNVTFLQRVAGGYTRAYFDAYRWQQGAAVAASLQAALNATRALYYSDPRRDQSYPTCSKHMLWRVGTYGSTNGAYNGLSVGAYDRRKRELIANLYDTEQCKTTWQIDILQSVYGDASYPWIAENTFPDPNPANWVPSPLYTRFSLLGLLEDGLMRSFQIDYTGVSSGTPNASCVLFDTALPAGQGVFAFLNDAGNSFLFPPDDELGTMVDLTTDDSDLTCAYPKEDDPRFASSDLSSCQPDTTQTAAGYTRYYTRCGNRECLPVPLRYEANGFYNCGYKSDRGSMPPCFAGNRQSCVSTVASAMYATVLQNYRPPPPRPLQAETLPWFQRAWPFAGFDLSDVLDYQSNIQPNPALSVMCEITTDPSAAIQFMQCQNEHYAALKAHVDSTYRRPGPPIAPAGTQLEWQMDRASLTQGFILSYASQNRSLALRYLDSLFDDNTVCKDPVVQNQRICWRNATGQFNSINPWLLGNFNPFHMCDVTFTNQNQQQVESIHAACYDNSANPNPACTDYGKMQVQSQCKAQDGNLVTMPSVPPMAHGTYLDYNLCHHELNEDPAGCMEDMGLLGGYNGLPVSAPPSAVNMLQGTQYANEAYTVAPNLYEDSAWAIPDDLQGGVFAGTNPLWAGSGDTPYGYLRANGSELGGHRIGLRLARAQPGDTISVLTVDRLPLAAEQPRTPVGSSGSLPVDQWVQGLQAAMAADGAANLRLYGLILPPASIGATCPLQRWAFYSGGFPSFAPTLPSPMRARHLFFPLHGGRLAHPTMQQDATGSNLGLYRSPNGFCACPVLPDIPQSQCLTDATLGGDCSLRETVNLLAGLQPFATSYVFTPFDARHTPQQCTMQLDWPNLNRTLRDGAPHAGDNWDQASSPTNRLCHVLDRLRPFRYKYVSDGAMGPSQGNTVSAGACQTGRAVTLDRTQLPAKTRCLRKTLSSTGATFVCTAATSAPPAMDRPRPPTPAVTASRRRTKRQWCSQCAAPPQFTSQQGAPIPPESSFGRLFRQSTERTLAKDLRDALCNVTGQCPPFNRSAWARGEFMRNYLTRPAALFLWPVNATPAPPAATPAPPAQDAAWEGKGWVYCPDTASLRTGVGCKGTMPRSEWVANRSAACSRMVRSFSTSNGTTPVNPVARTPFCNIDATTDTLCQRIVQARELVVQANCIARGTDTACLPKPFVYHPASYVASNNEWVHNTVNQFYNQLAAGTCPNDQMVNHTLTRAYQEGCPANAVNLFVGVLQILRYVVTDIATLLTTLVSMAVHLLAMMFTPGNNAHDMRASVGADWAIVRKKAGQSMSAVSDLLVDTLLNSGALGQRVMQFMDLLCQKGNWAIDWFLNVWCNYVKAYMISLLAGLQQAMGIIGTGFEILNDLMNYLFAGLLPAEFAEKYGSNLFQTLMMERYERPTSHTDHVEAANVPLKADARPVAAGSAARNADAQAARAAESAVSSIASDATRVVAKDTTTLLSRVGQAVSSAGPQLAVVGLLLMLPDMASQIQDMADRSKPHFFPSNFTLFKISDIVNIITDMSGFLQQDSTCYTFQVLQRHNYSYVFLPCLRLDMSAYAGSSAGTTSIAATLCWADAQPSLGQSSLMSCTAGSTCCRTSECLAFIDCGSCPAAPGPGTNQYGCDGVRQVCQCGQPASQITPCSANGQCGAAAQCEVMSALGSQSYGTTPCAQCPATEQVMCMLQPTGLPGQCTCLMASSLQYALCSDAAGSLTVPDPSQMCGYLPGYSARATVWAFAMEDLLLAPCSWAVAAVCSTVTQTDGPSLQMAVAIDVREGGRRRLLTFDDPEPDETHEGFEALDPATLAEVLALPGWERVAQPCRDLALAHQAGSPLGVLDTHELRRCAYWRFVGRYLVRRFDLTALEERDTFLVSWQDLAVALVDPAAVRALAGSFTPAWRALLYHPWARPARALARQAEEYLERLRWGQRFRHARRRAEARAGPGPAPQPPPAESPARRRLLSVQDDIQGVLAYSAQVISSAPAASVPTLVASAWSTADFVWPPAYNFSLAACPAGLTVLRLGQQVARIDMLYYQHFAGAPPPRIDRSLRGNLPAVSGWLTNASLDLAPRPASWPSAAFHAMLGLLRVSPSRFVAFFTTPEPDGFRWMLETAIQCDLASVNTCARHKRDLIMSTVVFGLLCALLTAVGGALGVPWVATALLLAYPSFILWYAFGVAPTCFPLVPTCLLADVIAAVGYVAPAQLLLPPSLLEPGGLVPCERLNFTSWADTLAFVLCDVDRPTCAAARGLRTGWPAVDRLWAPLLDAIARLEPVLDADAYDPHAHRVCAWVSFVWVVPLLGVAVLAAVLAYALCGAALALLPPAAEFAGQLLLFYQTE